MSYDYLLADERDYVGVAKTLITTWVHQCHFAAKAGIAGTLIKQCADNQTS